MSEENVAAVVGAGSPATAGGLTCEVAAVAMEPVAMTPVSVSERYAFLDILRGFALFGVLAANMRAFNLPMLMYDHTQLMFAGRADVWTQALMDVFISAKFWALFSFMFGLGFAIEMTRAQARSVKFPWFYLRRLGALAMFGVIHGMLIWNGDVLLSYAMGGFLLFWFRKAKKKTLLIWLTCMWGVGVLANVAFFVVSRLHIKSHIGIATGADGKLDMAKMRQIISVYQHARLGGVVRENVAQYFQFVWLQDLILGVLGLAIFMLGLYVWRLGVLQDLEAWKPRLKRVCAWTLPLGLALQAWGVGYGHFAPKHTVETVLEMVTGIADLPSVPMTSCGYATGLALLFLNARRRRWIAPLGPVGRMALTNYLTQSVVCMLFWTGITTGLYGRVGPAWDFVATLVLFGAQILFSKWWLARFRFGPAEYVWRMATYLKRP